MVTNTIEIKEYTPEYKAEIKRLIHLVLMDLGLSQPNRVYAEDPDLNSIETVYGGRGRFWVALKDGKTVVGTVAIRDMGGDAAKLNRMFVVTDLHGMGVGQLLLDKALEYAVHADFSKIVLNTNRKMKRAHRFYEKNGFIVTGEDEKEFYYEKALQSS